MNVHRLRSTDEKNAAEALAAASEKDFVSVVIVGVYKDGTSHMFKSMSNTIQTLGCLEAAKMFVYEGWKDR